MTVTPTPTVHQRQPSIVVLDLETSFTKTEDTLLLDNSPFNPANKIVSAHWKVINGNGGTRVKTCIFYHKGVKTPDSPDELLRDLKNSSILIAHNAKFDALYLLEAGIPIPGTIYCTMIGEYVLSRGIKRPLSLSACSKRILQQQHSHQHSNNVVVLKDDTVTEEYFKKGISSEDIPINTLIEYAEKDVEACYQLYKHQREELKLPTNRGLKPVVDLSNEMLLVICEMERNGLKIDLEALKEVEQNYLKEQEEITKDIKETLKNIMGDEPMNISSGADLCKIIYSREVINRSEFVKVFNIEVDTTTGKRKKPPYMSKERFNNAVLRLTRPCYKKVASTCPSCKGRGFNYKNTKYTNEDSPVFPGDNLFKVEPKTIKCKVCLDSEGVVYNEITPRVLAGLNLSPLGMNSVSVHGFKSDKNTLRDLQNRLKKSNHDFIYSDRKDLLKNHDDNTPLRTLYKQSFKLLDDLSRLSAIQTYLGSFVKNIKTWTRKDTDCCLHTTLNQTTTRTGRLSSNKPNFQNQPRSSTFPVRKCVVSRFNKGFIVEADFIGLEFRIAGHLSNDERIKKDVKDGTDVHKQTAAIINRIPEDKVNKAQRQEAKAFTFAPLYGGLGGSQESHVKRYFNEYFNIYHGLASWHSSLMDKAARDGIIITPSGREFSFPDVKRLSNGRVTNATEIVNYPVQSFATADIVPLACIRTLRQFKKLNLKSKIVLTVHDSIVIDVHPDEIDIVKVILTVAMESPRIDKEIKSRFDCDLQVELKTDISYGRNWMNLHKSWQNI